jgi:transcriptional regulator GlxA family with amidase domain
MLHAGLSLSDSTLKIQIIAYDGFDELDLVGPFEILRRATSFGADIVTEIVALDQTQLRGHNGLVIEAGPSKYDASSCDIVLIPGGGWADRSQKGAWAQAEKGDIPSLLKEFHSRRSKIISAVCTGTMIVASAGLLKGRNATTHHSAQSELRAKGAKVIDSRVVDDGEFITCGGVTSGLDLALYLVEKNAGAEVADKIEQVIEYKHRGNVWSRGR